MLTSDDMPLELTKKVEFTHGPADDLVPVSRHPEFQSGVTGIVLRGRPHAGPVRAAFSADADQVEGLHALAELGCKVMLEQHEVVPLPAGQHSPDAPGGLGDGGCEASLGDDGQVAGLRTRGEPHAQVHDAFLPRSPAGYRRDGSSATSASSDGRSAGEEGVSAVKSPPCRYRRFSRSPWL